MHRYHAYQLTVDSEIPLLGFPRAPGSGQADVVISAQKLAAAPTSGEPRGHLPPPPSRGDPWRVTESGVTLWVEGVGAFEAREGRTIAVDATAGATLGELGIHVRSSMWAALMMQRGYVPLHASCLDSADGAVLLVGNVGVGKSTLATALQYKGYSLVSDDLSVLRGGAGQFEMIPSLPEVRLWRESLEAFGIPPLLWGAPIMPGIPKYSLPALSWCGEVRRPRAIFFLQQGREDEPKLVRLLPAAALAGLSSKIYRATVLARMPGTTEPLQDSLASLVLGSTSFSLQYPHDLTYLPELCDRILSALAASPARPAKHWSQGLTLGRLEIPRPQLSRGGPRGVALLASYPKSGNTWVRALLSGAAGQTEISLESLTGDHPFLLRHQLEEGLGLDTDSVEPARTFELRSRLHGLQLPALGYLMPFKIHDLCRRSADRPLLFPPETVAGVIYIVRCPLDVVLSAASHFSQSLEETVTTMGHDGLWAEVNPLGLGEFLPQLLGSWSQHVRSWVDEPGYRCLVVRYEDLLRDALHELERMHQFFDLRWNEEAARQAVSRAGFDKLQRQEEERGFREKPLKAAAFFRKGVAGEWRCSLPSELALKIVRDHGDMMRRMGYGPEVDEVLQARRT